LHCFTKKNMLSHLFLLDGDTHTGSDG
jgi:hypothetical protein